MEDKQHILIIDDNESIRTSLVRVLHDPERYVIATAATQEDAMLLARSQEFDLVLCNHDVRGKNGVHILEILSGARPTTVTVLMTIRENLEAAVDAVNTDKINKYVVKPWDNKALRMLVRGSLDNLSPDSKLTGIKAEDIMSKFAITVKEDMLLLSAAHLMMRFKISGMPVLSSDERITGIVTATDLFKLMGEGIGFSHGSAGSRECSLVKDVMSRDVITVTRQTQITEIIDLMCDKNIHTLPVVESGELLGVIGRRDVINTYYSLLGSPEQ